MYFFPTGFLFIFIPFCCNSNTWVVGNFYPGTQATIVDFYFIF